MFLRARWWSRPMLMGFIGLLGLVAVGLVACSSDGSTSAAALPTATSGAISIMVDRASYSTSEPIGVTVVNRGHTTYYAVDGRSGCTYLQLQQYNQSKKMWVSVDGCTTSGITPQPQVIGKLSSLPFTLAPGDAPGNMNTWIPGLYRVVLQYGTKSDGSDASQLAYSAGFRIA